MQSEKSRVSQAKEHASVFSTLEICYYVKHGSDKAIKRCAMRLRKHTVDRDIKRILKHVAKHTSPSGALRSQLNMISQTYGSRFDYYKKVGSM